MKSKNKKLRVGFDMDGVLLYNPARTIRPIVSIIKKQLFNKKKTRFYYPETTYEQALFRFFHLSSFLLAPGFEMVKTLVRQEQIEAYIVTARFDYLKDDIDKWYQRMGGSEIFSGCYHNKDNQQPHFFKEKMMEELGLDVFIEDNWDIVKHINNAKKDQLKVLWITNLIDLHVIDYPHKYLTFKDAMYYLTELVARENE